MKRNILSYLLLAAVLTVVVFTCFLFKAGGAPASGAGGDSGYSNEANAATPMALIKLPLIPISPAVVPDTETTNTNPSTPSTTTQTTPATPASRQILLQIGKPSMLVNGVSQELDPGQGTAPVIVGGRTFLPIRAIIEAFSGTVAWDGAEQKVTIASGSTTIILHIGSLTASVNGETKNPDAAPFISDTGRTMLPVRFVSENLNLKVDWDAGTQTITISGAASGTGSGGTVGNTGGSGSQTSTGSQSGTGLTIPSGKFITSPNFKNNSILAGSGSAPGNFSKSLINVLPFLKNNPSLNAGMLQDLLGNSNQTPMALEDVTSDKNLAGVSFLGQGYDVITGQYANTGSVNEAYGPILDTDKLLKAGLILKEANSGGYYNFASGESAQSYSEQMATSVGLSGSYLFFGGSVKANFSSDSLSQTNSSFATLSYNASLYNLYIDHNANWQDYLAPDFAKAINDPTVDPNTIFEHYGTDVLLSEVMGGRLDYNASANSAYTMQQHDMQADMEASFNVMFASAGISASISQSTASSNFQQTASTNIKSYPVYTAGTVNAADFKDWADSMLSNPTLCDFGKDPFLPVYELASDPGRQQQIEDAYYKYCSDNDFVPAPHSWVITGIRLVHQFTVGDAQAGNIPDSFQDQTTGDTWQEVANIGAHTMDPGDGLTVVYVRYGWADGTNATPVAGIFFTNENNGFSPGSVDYAFQQMQEYKNDPTAKVWGYGHDELSNSGQDTYVTTSYGDKMRLYYVTGMNERPLVHLRVRWINPDGSTDYGPPAAPTDPQFLPVIDQSIALVNGAPVPQNCDADLGNVETMNSDVNPLIQNHYIEYSYQ